jgi:nucleoside-diphosphate-sugar epimerase
VSWGADSRAETGRRPDSAPGPAIDDVIVTGATGLIGPYLLRRLAEGGLSVQAISRRPHGRTDASRGGNATAGPHQLEPVTAPPELTWTVVDLAAAPADPAVTVMRPAAALVHAAPIWLLPAWLPTLADLGVRRVVAFSSTSRFTKEHSSSAAERALARRLADAEAAVEATAGALGMRWTLLRPSLIYGGGRDRNVSEIARFVARWGFFPVAGEGRGRRQPVHAADLAAAAASVLDTPATFDRAYDVPGGETLTYAEMVTRIARGLGRTPRLLHLPLPLLRAAAGAARLLPRWRHVTSGMADRMNEDLVFDPAPARHDFGYDPRPFAFPDVDARR